MTLSGFFYGLGDLFQWTFNLLQNDLPITRLMNTGILLLGFVGMLFWLNKQRKFNTKAEGNPDQIK